MLCIEVNLLTGHFVATSHHDRSQWEWPPHPARLFSAMVATWADTSQPDPSERAALEWLECQRPPSIAASVAVHRKVVTHFVPVNDAKVGTTVESAVNILPPGWITYVKEETKRGKTKSVLISRTRQARKYPSATPAEPRLSYVWEATPTDEVRSTLDCLLSRVTRLGHASSLVSCRVVTDPPTPNHVPGPGEVVLRAVRSGQLAALEQEYRKHRAIRPRTLPFTPVRYRRVEHFQTEVSARRPDTSGEWLVLSFQRQSRRFPSTLAVEIATALRGAVFHHAEDPIPEGLSGHRPNGRPSAHPHVAFLPLPWVGHQHSDGRLMGAAIAVPHSLDNDSRRALFRAIGRWEAATGERPALTLGRRGRLEMQRVIGPPTLITLRHSLWSRKSRTWISATPIALPTHPGPLSSGTTSARAKAWLRAEQAVINSCDHIGLPKPARITLSLAPLMPGARPAPAFPTFRQPGRGGEPVARRLLHTSVTFEREVIGPMVLGAGRYLGLGLMMPVSDPRSEIE